MTERGSTWDREYLGKDEYRTTFGLKPTNYQDGSTWKPIANDWQDSGDGDRPHIVTAAPFMVSEKIAPLPGALPWMLM